MFIYSFPGGSILCKIISAMQRVMCFKIILQLVLSVYRDLFPLVAYKALDL